MGSVAFLNLNAHRRVNVTRGLLFFAVAVGAAYGQTVNVTVPGSANPFLAGMPNATTCCTGDSAPAQSPVQVSLAVTPGATITFSATGSVLNSSGSPVDPPDGSSLTCAPSANGVGSVCANVDALLGSSSTRIRQVLRPRQPPLR
jgi:hypothetical protein